MLRLMPNECFSLNEINLLTHTHRGIYIFMIRRIMYGPVCNNELNVTGSKVKRVKVVSIHYKPRPLIFICEKIYRYIYMV